VRDPTQAFTKLEFSLTLPIDQPVYLGTGLAIVKETIGGRACGAAVSACRFSFSVFRSRFLSLERLSIVSHDMEMVGGNEITTNRPTDD
jgi:hypothetical protein